MTPEDFQRFALEYLGWLGLAIFAFVVAIFSFVVGIIFIFSDKYLLFGLAMVSMYMSYRIMKWAGRIAIEMLKEFDIKR